MRRQRPVLNWHIPGRGATTPLIAGMAILAIGLFASSSSAGVVVQYNFDGNALDSSGLGNHGTIEGNPSFVPGLTNQAIFFNNPEGQELATQWVSLPNSPSITGLQNSSFTFAILYRSTNASMTNGRLFGHASSLQYVYNAGDVPGSYVQIRDTSGRVLGTRDPEAFNPPSYTTDGQWHWGITVFDQDARELRYYVDTNLVAIRSLVDFGSVLFSDLSIGRINHANPSFRTFGALLTAVDNFQLHDRALNTDEINALVNPTAVPEPGSLALLGVACLSLVGYRRWRRN